MNLPSLLTCAASNCSKEFYPVVPNQKFCCGACGNRERVRQYRAKHRKNGGGGGGGGNGGGAEPTLFDTITPQDSRAIYVPDTCYRPFQISPPHSSTFEHVHRPRRDLQFTDPRVRFVSLCQRLVFPHQA